jgi:hypothetical protein
VNGYLCQCLAGYSGPNCEVNVDECASGPCLNAGLCIDGVNNYTCRCDNRYRMSLTFAATVLRIRIRDPGRVKIKIRIPDHISDSLETIFVLKYLNSLIRIRDLGIFLILVNIPDPQQ